MAKCGQKCARNSATIQLCAGEFGRKSAIEITHTHARAWGPTKQVSKTQGNLCTKSVHTIENGNKKRNEICTCVERIIFRSKKTRLNSINLHVHVCLAGNVLSIFAGTSARMDLYGYKCLTMVKNKLFAAYK